ncbi:hypothetical protein RRG08_040294 [Elysia crispata]|uniref:Uncharacterized protein n=1 Tax=Elysia crispata TaxID=231223 RepID=A0AAE0Z2I9_9GAST|nr:hypothetical protein RRG08_040294 [Elysia crispata]
MERHLEQEYAFRVRGDLPAFPPFPQQNEVRREAGSHLANLKTCLSHNTANWKFIRPGPARRAISVRTAASPEPGNDRWAGSRQFLSLQPVKSFRSHARLSPVTLLACINARQSKWSSNLFRTGLTKRVLLKTDMSCLSVSLHTSPRPGGLESSCLRIRL